MTEQQPAPRSAAQFGIRMVLSLVAAFSLLFAVIRVADQQWPTVIFGFLSVFVTVAVLAGLGVLIDVVDNRTAERRARRYSTREQTPVSNARGSD